MNFDCHALNNKFETKHWGVKLYGPDTNPALLDSKTKN